MRASLVIPALNESGSIGHVLDEFRNVAEPANRAEFSADPIQWQILVIDGGSVDGTADEAREHGATVIVEPRKGYGRAYKTGFEQATGDIVVTMDGDATYPVDAIPGLMRRLLDAPLDFISCDRLSLLAGKAMTTEHRIGNWILNSFLGIAYSRILRNAGLSKIVDSQSGMWLFRRSILDQLDLSDDGMPFSEELKLEVLFRGYRFEETPVRYSERWGAPKLSSWRDGYKNLAFLFRKRLKVAQETKRRRALALSSRRAQLASR